MVAQAQPSSATAQTDEQVVGWLDLIKTVRLTLGPLRWRGDLTMTSNNLWLPGQTASRTFQQSGNLTLATYVYQPWFAQVGANLGLAWTKGSGAAGGATTTLNGSASLTVFPASRFPLEANVALTDTRASEDLTGADYRSLQFGVRQQYRTLGDTQYTLRLDHSELSGNTLGKDVLNVASASVSGRHATQSFNGEAFASANEAGLGRGTTSIRRIAGTHRFVPAENVNLETLATYDWQENVQRSNGPATRLAGEFVQLAAYATWRPEEDEPLYDADHPMLFTGAVRLSAVGVESDGASAQVVTANATVGASYEFSPRTRATAGGSVTHTSGRTTAGRVLGSLHATVAHDPEPMRWGATSYSWNVSGGGTAAYGGDQDRVTVYVQASQQLVRSVEIAGSLLALSIGQSYAARHDDREGEQFVLGTNAQATWTLQGRANTQTYVGLGLSDQRSIGTPHQMFQLVNLQLTHQGSVDALSHWSANLTVQGSRQQSQSPLGTSVASSDTGLRGSVFGSLSYQHRRLFGVPRLSLTATFTANQSQLQSRALGDVQASPRAIRDALDVRLEHRIGKLESRLTFRSASVEGRRNSGVFLRVTRHF
jgi:hypothetical protein